MNSQVKLAVFCAISAVLGGGIGYLVADYLLSKKSTEISGEVFPEVDFGTDKVEILPKDEIEWIPGTEVGKKKTPGKKRGSGPVDYTTFRKSHLNKESLDDVARTRLGIEKDKPYVITFDDFLESLDSYSKVHFMYYELDDVLANGDGAAIVNPELVVGDALLNFGVGSNDPDVVYVRDEKKTTDYEIARVHKSYSEVVLGVKLEDSQKFKQRKTKRGRTKKVDSEESESDNPG